MGRIKSFNIKKVIQALRLAVKGMEEPIVTKISKKNRSPFFVLVSTILSARTKDDVTKVASERLLERASTPEKILELEPEEIEQLIYPVGFYKNKAKALKNMCAQLLDIFGGQTPDSMDDLLKLSGVGRKTANLVLTLGFGKLGICVDTHVHRISNRLGYVKTKTPEQTEQALRKKLPKEYWIEYNDLLVTYGQNLCRPISPVCSKCKIEMYCKKIEVKKSR